MPAINQYGNTTVFRTVVSTNSQILLASENGKRAALYIYNNTATSNLFIMIGTTAQDSTVPTVVATTGPFMLKIAPGSLYEMPRGLFTEAVYGIWDLANDGSCFVTEVSGSKAIGAE